MTRIKSIKRNRKQCFAIALLHEVVNITLEAFWSLSLKAYDSENKSFGCRHVLVSLVVFMALKGACLFSFLTSPSASMS